MASIRAPSLSSWAAAAWSAGREDMIVDVALDMIWRTAPKFQGGEEFSQHRPSTLIQARRCAAATGKARSQQTRIDESCLVHHAGGSAGQVNRREPANRFQPQAGDKRLAWISLANDRRDKCNCSLVPNALSDDGKLQRFPPAR